MPESKVTRNAEYGQDAVSAYPPELTEKRTSITAHIMRMVSINMSMTEMDIICEIIDRGIHTLAGLSVTEKTVGQEFIQAIESIK